MPFGFRTAPETFPRALDIIPDGVRWKNCLIYLYDVISFSATGGDRSEEHHVEDVEAIIMLQLNSRVTLKLNKCALLHKK